MTEEVLGLLQSTESPEAQADSEPEAASPPPARSASPQNPDRSPAEQLRFGKEEGGSETVRAFSAADPAILSHLSSLRAQEAELRREVPDFTLEDAFRDTDFLRLTSPTVGISVRRAYFALHGAERERRAAEESARRLAQSVASGARRPQEGGGHTAAALTAADPAQLSAAQRRELKARITAAAARGEKIYP